MARDEDRAVVPVPDQFPRGTPVRLRPLRLALPRPARPYPVPVLPELLPNARLTRLRTSACANPRLRSARNACHALAGYRKIGPSGSLESRTAISPDLEAASTQSPLAMLWPDFRHSMWPSTIKDDIHATVPLQFRAVHARQREKDAVLYAGQAARALSESLSHERDRINMNCQSYPVRPDPPHR
jgi:hypothetical protein